MPFSDVIPEHTINRFLLRSQLQWELSVCHLCVASTLAHLHCLAIRFDNFKLFCLNKWRSMAFQSNRFYSFSGKFISSFLSLCQACHATLNRLWKCYAFLTILPLSGQFDAKDISSAFPFPPAKSLSFLAALLNGCTSW